MKIEAVSVCVNYADFLAQTLPFNMVHFDKFVVVTSYEDKETQELCRRLSVECRPTDLMSMDDESFNKGRAIDFGMAFLGGDEWICHIDADTWLPPMTRYHLSRAQLDPDTIYGIDRCQCVGWDRWKEFISEGLPVHQHDYLCRVRMPNMPMLDRISIPDYAGYIPIGFFQLWHGRTKRRYPLHHGTAERTDVLHAIQWPTRNRQLLGEVVAIHLESEISHLGANWRGRKTPRFEPRPKHHHRDHHHHHHCPKPPPPYMGEGHV